MTAKEYLSQYKDLNDSINAKLEQVGELRRKAQTVGSGSSDGAHSSTPRDRIGEITARIVDLEHEINEDIDRSIDLQREIRAAIATVPEVRLRTLLAGMAQNRIILVATHVVSDVETVATKVILLRAGKIVDAAPVPELIAKYAPDQGLEDVYLNVFGEGDGK